MSEKNLQLCIFTGVCVTNYIYKKKEVSQLVKKSSTENIKRTHKCRLYISGQSSFPV